MLLGNKHGAGKETRTLDIFLGKEVLYQLSYTRIFLAESQGVEPCERITTLYGLAIRCLTVRPAFQIFNIPTVGN